MRPSLRFLALALVGWTGVRAMTVGAVPGAELFSIRPSAAKPPPILATQFPPIEPVQPAGPEYFVPAGYYGQGPQYWPMRFQPNPGPVHYASAPALASRPAAWTLTPSAPGAHGSAPSFDEWPLTATASMPPPRQSRVVLPAQSIPAPMARRALDRLQLSTWALLRGQQGMEFGPPSLASGGQLGGSQAGARLSYHFTRQIAASARMSSDVGRSGGEIAGGVRIQPVRGLPLWLTAERRQRIGSDSSGRNAFALFAEGGVYQRPMPWDFELDAYLQAGVVGFQGSDAFVDGAMTFTRPVYRQFSVGLGMWGGAQPGVSRLDAGPRLSMKVRNNVRVHFDWRQRLAGNAAPGSGPAITLAGDF